MALRRRRGLRRRIIIGNSELFVGVWAYQAELCVVRLAQLRARERVGLAGGVDGAGHRVRRVGSSVGAGGVTGHERIAVRGTRATGLGARMMARLQI